LAKPAKILVSGEIVAFFAEDRVCQWSDHPLAQKKFFDFPSFRICLQALIQNAGLFFKTTAISLI